jgi:hypothetical protein
MFLITLRILPEEEEERPKGRAAEPARVVRGAIGIEGTSMVMVGAIGF